MVIVPVLAIALFSIKPVIAIEVGNYPELQTFIDQMQQKHAFDRQSLLTLFQQAEIRDDILEIIAHPGEAQPWYKYKTRFLTREHVEHGKRFWRDNHQAIQKASKAYKVPAEVIVAIIGIETNYGRTPGRHRVIDALTTLVLKYPRRKDFFRRELEDFLLLTREQGLDPLAIHGSYTGAIGLPQFMPSSYRAYAIDLDGNGSANLEKSKPDSIGSVANYISIHGWKSGQPITSQVRLEGDLYPWLSDLGGKPIFTLRELARYGVYSEMNIDPDRKAALLSFQEDAHTSYRLVFHNFFVIRRYNNSPKYALAVAELSTMLKNAYRSNS